MIGCFPIARTVSGYENQILIGHKRERNVVRKKAAVCGEERCVTAAKETTIKYTNFGNILDFLFVGSEDDIVRFVSIQC